MVDTWKGEAAKEPPRGDAAAAMLALRMFGFTCNHSSCAAIVLQALASGKVTWLSDNSVSGPAAIEGDPPPPPHSLHKLCTLWQNLYSLRSLSNHLRRPRHLARSSVTW